MSRDERIVVRCTAAEKKLLSEVAFAMQRTLSDAVRILVHEKARAWELLVPTADAPDIAVTPPSPGQTGDSWPESVVPGSPPRQEAL